jgi:acetylornithine/succinyldiaminopimelate/putrescine aminotransferase
MQDGFHGRSLGSLAATGIDKYRQPYAGVLPPAHFVPFGDIDAVDSVLAADHDIAALIIEPIQSMAGVTLAPDAYYQALRETCTRHGVVLIFDEVQTGVGRTGTFSISEQFGMTPDIITMAKSLASGVPIGALLASDALSGIIKSGDQGTTFGGGMLAMAALLATLETIQDEDLMSRAAEIFEAIEDGVRRHVKNVRGRGCLIGLEFDAPVAPVIKALRERGILSGSSMNPNAMRLMPPLNTENEELTFFVDAFKDAVKSAN